MKFLTIKAKNFMQFQKLGIDLCNKGLCLINGEIEGETFSDSNTAGKTTAIVHTLMWGLFGETLTELKGDDVINDIENKNCKVSIWFIHNNIQYEIIRYRKHKDFKNELHLFTYKDKEKINLTKSSNSETQEEITNLFNLNWTIFTNTILFGQGNIKRFSELGDTDRKKLLDDILNLSILQEYHSKIKDKIKIISTELVTIKYSIDTNYLRYAQFDGFLKSTITDKDKFEINKKDRINTLLSDIELIQHRIDKLLHDSTEVNDVQTKINKLTEVLILLKKDEEQLEAILEKINNIKLNIRKNDIEIINVDKLISINTNKIKNILNDNREDCDSCGNEITDSSKNKFIEKFKNEIIQLENNKVNYNNIDLNKKLELLNNKYNILKTKLFKKNDIIKAIYDLENKIKINKHNLSMVDTLKDSIKDKELQITNIKNEQNNYDKYIEDYTKELNTILLLNTELESNINTLNGELEYLKFWEIGFSNSGIKSLMLDNIVPMLTEKTNYYLDYLTNGEIKVLFDTQTTLKNSDDKRDKLSIKLFKNGKEYDFKKTSGGEKRRIDICISLSLQYLNSNSFNTNITVFDEVFDSLDETGVDCVINLLNEEIKNKDSIFVISHDSNLKDKFKNILTVKKIYGISEVVEN